MKNNSDKLRISKQTIAVAVLVGMVILLVATFISTNVDMSSAERTLKNTTSYIKEQCNRFARIELASETKSLMRVTESAKQISRQIDSDKSLKSERTLEYYAHDNYVSGVLLLDGDGNILDEFHEDEKLRETISDTLRSSALLDTAKYSEKLYAVRIDCDDGGEVDVAAVARKDVEGIVVAYYHTTAEYKNSFSLSVAAMLDGYQMEREGTVVVSNGDTIVASNDDALIGTSTDTIAVLRRITMLGKENKLFHSNSEAGSISQDFGLMQRGRNFYVYAYLSEGSVFVTTPSVAVFTLIAYIFVLVGIAMVRSKTAQGYREEQMKAQEEYAQNLQSKNEQLKAAIDRAERANLAKTGFLSRMSHDIRTPLNGIIGLLEIDDAHPDDAELVQANRKKMRISANHLLSLLNDTLQMSKLESGEFVLAQEPVDLASLSQEILSIVEHRAAEASVTLESDYGGKPFKVNWIMGSPLHLRQLFLNVYTNCIKYNKVGGKVTTTLQCVEQTESIVTYRWTITDTGIGMSDEFLKHIFDPFTQENTDARSVYQGTGLGMAIVKGLVDKMNGTIEISSQKGVGSTFVITLPFDIAEPTVEQQTATTEVEPACDVSGLSVLVVEDNDLNAEIVQTLLQDAGAKVTSVTDGKQALELFEETTAGTFDVILMDMMMPVMDGLTATRKIRALDRPDAKTIPIIAMTANAFTEDGEKCFEAGMNAHVAKPIDLNRLKQIICNSIVGKNKHE